MKQVDLQGTPRPHYLKEAEISHDGNSLVGIAIFPSDDPSIGDRNNHVNVAHHLFAAWNAAHLMARHQVGKARLWAVEVIVRARRVTLPDKPIRIEASLNIESRHGHRAWGQYRVFFYNESDERLAELEVKFVADTQ